MISDWYYFSYFVIKSQNIGLAAIIYKKLIKKLLLLLLVMAEGGHDFVPQLHERGKNNQLCRLVFSSFSLFYSWRSWA